jgi:hypothetical protein
METESQVRTNIISVDPVQQEQPNQEEIKPDEKESTQEVSYSEKLAQDAIKFMYDEFKGDMDDKFWSFIRDEANRRLTSEGVQAEVKVGMEPLSADQSKRFLADEIPFGKYAGMKVGTVLKKEPDYLKKLASRPLPFQIKLQRYLCDNKVANL